jgi:hypothetical protein
VYGEAKKQMRLSERILAELPGFRGYKEKELRRESDRLIRNQLYRKLSGAKSGFKDVFQKISDRRTFEVLTDMDRVMAKFDRVSEKVNHASYGYTGFFDVVKVKEENLDRMIDFDNRSEIEKQKFDKAKDHARSVREALDAFEEAFDGREEVILGVS